MIQSKHRRSVMAGIQTKTYIVIGSVVVALMLLLIIVIAKTGSRLEAMDSIEVKLIRRRGILRVGVCDDAAGFTKDGVGLEMDLAKTIGDYILPDASGNSVEFIVINSRMTYSYLSDGTIDIALMRMPLNEYTGKYAYSTSYYSDTCVIALTENNTSISIDGAKIGYISNTICQTRITSYASENNIKITSCPYASYDMMLKALEKKHIDAIVLTGVEYSKFANDYKLYQHQITLKNIEYSVVCSTDTPALTEIATSIINDMKSSGELENLCLKYLN